MSDHATLDPEDWQKFREQAHHMLDDMLDYQMYLREQPVWQQAPEAVRSSFSGSMPEKGTDLEQLHAEFMTRILPYVVGNAHPGFMGWVHGGGTPVGMLAEMLAAGLNVNAGGRNQIAGDVERQVTGWMRDLFGFPESASGLFVAGTSMATMVSLLVARNASLGGGVRASGLQGQRMTAYAAKGAHQCIARALDMAGIGSEALRLIDVDEQYRLRPELLARAIDADRAAGFTPFFVAATVGSVDVGAIDDLHAIAQVADTQSLWFHVDGAYGALAMLTPEIAPRLAGIERADAIAFDFHKWGQVPYDCGFTLVRDGAAHRGAFALASDYLSRAERGLAAGSSWPCDYGPDLSRGFRALKAWFTIRAYGSEALGRMIWHSCELARHLQNRIAIEAELELMAPVGLNIVCFRFRCDDSERVNAEIVIRLQESGIVAPSSTRLNGKLAIRAAIVNHRTAVQDLDALVDAVLAQGRSMMEGDVLN